MQRPNIEWLESALKTWPHQTIHPDVIRNLIEYIDYLEAQDRRRDWPTDLHEQYLAVLDERDKLQRDVDIYSAIVEDMPTDDLFEIYEEEYKEQYGEDA